MPSNKKKNNDTHGTIENYKRYHTTSYLSIRHSPPKSQESLESFACLNVVDCRLQNCPDPVYFSSSLMISRWIYDFHRYYVEMTAWWRSDKIIVQWINRRWLQAWLELSLIFSTPFSFLLSQNPLYSECHTHELPIWYILPDLSSFLRVFLVASPRSSDQWIVLNCS